MEDWDDDKPTMKMVRSKHTAETHAECEFLDRMFRDVILAFSNENPLAVARGYAVISIPRHLVGKAYSLHQLYQQSPSTFAQIAALVLNTNMSASEAQRWAVSILDDLKREVLDQDQEIQLWRRLVRKEGKKSV
jgi:hypothetical protein